MGKSIIFSAPSGSGKSTIVSKLLKQFQNLRFSVSATTREPRGEERDGVDYHFLTETEFKGIIEGKGLVEYEEVYAGTFYGTLKSELEKIWAEGNIVVFDVDVVGGCKLKEVFGGDALSVFIKAPSMKVLRERLTARGTDNAKSIEKRLAKAEEELSYQNQFDVIVVNDELDMAFEDAVHAIEPFITN